MKQSAVIQDWHRPGDRLNRGRFDIAARTGRWEGSKWIAAPGRAADIYVFAWHGIEDFARADHRDAKQWRFHVVNAPRLPPQKTISLTGVAGLTTPVSIDEVKASIETSLGPIKRNRP